MKYTLLTLALVAPVANGEVVSLTQDNYKEKTTGKSVFIKFFAPWCGHCKSMAPAWEQLAEDWADHEVTMIAEIDCTQEQTLCEDFDVTGYPTLFYGDPMSPDPYDGGRDYESLSTFTKENLGTPICSVFNSEACSDAEKKIIAELEAKSSEELATLVADVEEKAEAAEAIFDAAVEELQKNYEKMVEDYNLKVDAMKLDSNYAFARALLHKKDAESLAGDGDEL